MSRDPLYDLLPPEAHLGHADSADLAVRIFPELINRWRNEKRSFCFYNMTIGDECTDQEKLAMAEALSWLISQGLLIQQPGHQAGWYVPSRRAQSMHSVIDLEAYRKGNLLPKSQLHPAIAQAAFSDFMRGEYQGAVFKAFVEVEIAVRQASKFDDSLTGVDLVRKAFNSDSGPLTDQGRVESERQALAHLFAGAFGSYRNPVSHRRVALDGEQTAEMILLASHLLKIVDSRSAKNIDPVK